jgi:hypothetical protein
VERALIEDDVRLTEQHSVAVDRIEFVKNSLCLPDALLCALLRDQLARAGA